MINTLLELMAEHKQDFTIREGGEGKGWISLFTKANSDTYRVIGQMLHSEGGGVKGEGRCGGGFEIYPLKDGTTFAVAYCQDDTVKMTIAKMGGAF